jgi:hypothetical protein
MASEEPPPPPVPPAPDQVLPKPTRVPRTAPRVAVSTGFTHMGDVTTSRNLIIRFPESPGETTARMSPEMARRYGLNIGDAASGARKPSGKQSTSTSISDQWRSETRELNEDLTVMSRILEKAMEKEGAAENEERALGIVVSGVKNRQPSAIYLQGYGAVFVFDAPFPLSGPEKAAPAPEKSTADSTWEQTRKELFDQDRRAGGFMSGDLMGPGQAGPDSESDMEYDPARVEALKQSLISALKSGANIRHMGPRDLITVVVRSGLEESGIATAGSGYGAVLQQRYGLVGPHVRLANIIHRAGPGGPAQQLVIQASRTDIVDLASNKINADEFARRVDVAVY